MNAWSRCVLLLALYGVAVTPFVPTSAKIHRGSLVVAMVSQKGEYVVVAAESRNLDEAGKPLNDRACKIIALGGDTLFFETGLAAIGVNNGKPWNALSAARAVYRRSKRHDAKGLSVVWGNKALRWFYGQSRQDLKNSASDGGRLVSGGFVDFEGDGTPSVQAQAIVYNDSTNALSRGPDGTPPGLGQIAIAGIPGLAQEFFEGKTKRAIAAFGPVGVIRLIGVDPTIDSGLARKAIQFAIDNATGKEKLWLGGPIDIAILRKNRTIEWTSRKKECYEKDLQPTR